MDIIKEHMFFVVMGVVVLIALVLFVVLVQPMKKHNQYTEADVRNLLTSLTTLRNKKDLPNDVAIAKATKYKERYEEQFRALVDDLSKKSLSIQLPGLAPEEQDAPGAFKTVYEKGVKSLKRQLSDKGITSDRDAWCFWDWGGDVPKQPVQRVIATKQFSLIKELVDIITSHPLRVMQVDRLEVDPGQTRTAEFNSTDASRRLRVEPYFDVFPFVLEVRMPFQNHELLLRDLLTSKKEIPIYVRKVSMMRLEDDPRVLKYLPDLLYVGVRVEGWALDYKPQEKKPDLGGRPTSPYEGGRVRGGVGP